MTAENNEGKTIYSLALNLNGYFYFRNIPDKILVDSTTIKIKDIKIKKSKIYAHEMQDNKEKQLIYKLSNDQIVEDTGL